MGNIVQVADPVKARLITGYRYLRLAHTLPGRAAMIRADLLLSALSDSQIDVWFTLLGLRDQDGIAHPSIDGISRIAQRPRRTVQRALQKLGQIGLVVSAGYRFIERAQREVYTWEVWGHFTGKMVKIPHETATWLAERPKRRDAKPVRIEGVRYPSRRAAARALGVSPDTIARWAAMPNPPSDVRARPVKARPAPMKVMIHGVRYPSVAAAARVYGVPRQTAYRRLQRGWRARAACRRPGDYRVPEKKGFKPRIKLDESQNLGPELDQWKCTIGQKVAPLLEHSSPSPSPRRGEVKELSRSRARFFSSVSPDGKSGSWLGGRKPDAAGWWPFLVNNDHIPRPPNYCGQKMPMVTIPTPELLNPEDPPEIWADRLAATFRSVSTDHYGRNKSWYFAKGKIQNSKYYGKLVAWAELMLSLPPEKQIPPVFWLRFMLARWEYSNTGSKKRAVMSPAFAFNPEKLRQPNTRGWCRKEMRHDRIHPGRVVVSDQLRALLARHNDMRRALFRLGPWSPLSRVQEVVDQYFPDDLYGVMYQAAQVGQRQLRRSVGDRVARGDLSLWGRSNG